MFPITFSEPAREKKKDKTTTSEWLGIAPGSSFPQAKGNALPSVTLKKQRSKAASLALTKETLFFLIGRLKQLLYSEHKEAWRK